MLASRPVARFAGVVLKTTFLIGFYFVMRILLEGLENIFVAGMARFRPHIGGRFIVWRRSGSALRLLSAPGSEANHRGCRQEDEAAAAGWEQSGQSRSLLFSCVY